MRRFLCLLLLLVACGPNAAEMKGRILGQWNGQGGVSLEFRADDTIRMKLPGDVTVRDGTYKLNFNNVPYWLDIQLNGMSKPISTIFIFDEEGRLKVQATQPGQARPAEFNGKAVFFFKATK